MQGYPGVERPQLQVGLAFHPWLELLDVSRCTILGGDHGYTHVATEVIHEQQEVLATPLCCQCDWTVQVLMHWLQAPSHSILRLHRE
jgi:hypothetical protein